MEKKATVESRLKFHEGYPTLGSARLSEVANPKISRTRRLPLGCIGFGDVNGPRFVPGVAGDEPDWSVGDGRD
jgi:hypothetical protein